MKINMIVMMLVWQLAYASEPNLPVNDTSQTQRLAENSSEKQSLTDKSQLTGLVQQQTQYLKEVFTQLARQLEAIVDSHNRLVKQQFEQLNQEVQKVTEEVQKTHQQLSQIESELRQTNRHLEKTNAILEKISNQIR